MKLRDRSAWGEVNEDVNVGLQNHDVGTDGFGKARNKPVVVTPAEGSDSCVLRPLMLTTGD